jgi:NAD(P)-dependent dehydrogenase (short-subunit alcohol dehydrogenase family)
LNYPLPHASTDLTGQVALVTGASGGLGRRFAMTLASAGAAVVVAARRIDKLARLTEEIEAAGGCCISVALDKTNADQINTAVQTAEGAFGTVTILVNNAGIADAMRAHKMPLELIDAVLATNVRGPFLLSCEVARRLITAQKPGRIVNLSSWPPTATTAAPPPHSTQLAKRPLPG